MLYLSVCMPSHRNLADSRASIETALAFCEARDAVLVISDNSGDLEKRAYWQNRSVRLHYIIAPDDDIDANYMSSITNATTPFILQMGDDDQLGFDPAVPAFDFASLPADYIGVRPLTQVWAPKLGVVRTKAFGIAEEDAGARILEYNQVAGGDNSAFYSIFRREPYTAMMALFLQHHPTRGGYCDWAKVMALFAYGRMAYDPGTIFKYNFEQWSSNALIAEKTVALYEGAGLPADGQKYHMLLLFLDLFVFLSRPGTPLGEEQRLNAISVTAGSVFNGFLSQVKQAPENYSETMQYLCEMASEEFDSFSRFQIGLLMADNIKSGLKDGYIAYYKAAVAA